MTSQVKVDSIRHTGASADAITLASDGSCTAELTNRQGNNLIINGSCVVAQRGSSSTSTGYQTVDRFQLGYSGHDEALTQAQHALTSSDTGPWEKGFRQSFHITNGNQTSGAGAGDQAHIGYLVEAQDLANSGWDYTSASSYITLSFWVRSSVAQTFYGYIQTHDGTSQSYSISTGSLSANTWTKVTKKIPGNSNIQIDNNNDKGMSLWFLWPYAGGDRTTSGHTLGAWQAYSGSDRMPDNTSTWWTTNDATIEVTGVQLEVGEFASEFDHRSYAEELQRCLRYYWLLVKGGEPSSSSNPQQYIGDGGIWGYNSATGTDLNLGVNAPVPLRASPTIDQTNGSDYYYVAIGGAISNVDGAWIIGDHTEQRPSQHWRQFTLRATVDASYTVGLQGRCWTNNDSAKIALSAEL